MNKFLKGLFLLAGLTLIFSALPLNAAGNWTVETKVDLSSSIRDVFFLQDGMTGWFVGNDGAIMKTTDGGVTLMAQTSNVTEHINKVIFISDSTGWAVGENGTIIKTTDAGENWVVQTSPDATADYNDIAVASATHAIAVADGGHIHATTDGEMWIAQTSGTTNNLYGVSNSGSNQVIAVGQYETVLHSSDWGTTWTAATTPPSIQGKDCNAVKMVSDTKAWIVGDGFSTLGLKSVLAMTEDGGDTWAVFTPVEEAYGNLWDIDFTNDSTGIAVGDAGIVFKTTNGTDWVQAPVGFGFNGSCVSLIGDNAWVCQYETIAKSSDFAETWELLVKITGHNLYKIHRINEGHIIAVGYNSAIMETIDGGYNWQSKYLVADNTVATQLWGIHFVNADTGWVVGTGGFIAKTEDAGTTWHLKGEGVTTKWLREVVFVNDSTGWIIAANGQVLSTIDGGETWTDQTGLPNETLYTIYMFDENNGVIGGADNTIYYTTDGGTTWNAATHAISGERDINSVYFLDATHGWAVGENGTVQFSNDAGLTWTSQTSNTTKELEEVYFRNTLDGWIVGDGGLILATTDGGTTWAVDGEGTTSNKIMGIVPKHSSILYAAAYSGTILKYVDKDYVTTSKIKINEIFANAFRMTELECQYTELYNAGTETEYLDGKIICRLTTDIDGITYIWQFPGTGTDYPIEPGEYKILTPDAKEYTDIDLSNADFEFYVDGEFKPYDNPDVPNLTSLRKTSEFFLAYTSDEVILCSGKDIYWEDGIDVETIIDGVEFDKSETSSMSLNDLVDEGHAIGPPANYLGIPVERKTPGMDTNNSTNDFRMTNGPTPWATAASYSISGAVNYFSNNNAVTDVTMTLDGTLDFAATSGVDGTYLLDYLVDGTFQLNPEKTGDTGSAIDPFDAALILKYCVTETTLTAHQKIAGDVTENGEVTPYDASFILRKHVGALTSYPSGNDWRFVPASFIADESNWAAAPASISYDPLNSDQTSQNFVGYVIGDVSGNWGETQLAKINGLANINFGEVEKIAQKVISIPIMMKQNTSVVSGSFKLNYDAKRYTVKSVRAGEIISGAQFAHDAKDGIVAFAFASAYPVQGKGVVATVDLEVLRDQNNYDHAMEVEAIRLNEGTIAIQVNGQSLSINSNLPQQYSLRQNYPNPFNPETTISFDLPEDTKLSIKVYDILGQEVATIVDKRMTAGSHTIKFNGKNLASGVYFYRITSSNFTSVKKMILLK